MEKAGGSSDKQAENRKVDKAQEVENDASCTLNSSVNLDISNLSLEEIALQLQTAQANNSRFSRKSYENGRPSSFESQNVATSSEKVVVEQVAEESSSSMNAMDVLNSLSDEELARMPFTELSQLLEEAKASYAMEVDELYEECQSAASDSRYVNDSDNDDS